MHLLDIPKPKRSARLFCVPISLLFGVCVAVYFVWSQTPDFEESTGSIAPASKAIPVKWVTVTNWYCHHGLCVPAGNQRMSLMELYDELCEIKERAKHCTSSPYPNDARKREIFAHSIKLYEERLFRESYGLTLEQVAMIKREGHRMKSEALSALSRIPRTCYWTEKQQ